MRLVSNGPTENEGVVMKRFQPTILVVFLIGAAAASLVQANTCGWLQGFTIPDLDTQARAFAVYDDGTGPALFVAGRFDTAGGVLVNHIARWDGSSWSALSGPSGTGLDGIPNELAVFDDGTGPALYVGGYFDNAGGVAAQNIAKWDGTEWSALPGASGIGVVYDLNVFDDGAGTSLFVAGNFNIVGSVTANNVARFNGVSWFALGTGTSGDIDALAVYDDGTGAALYACGSFDYAGDLLVNHVAKWDGTVWSALSGPSDTGLGGLFHEASILAVYDDGTGAALYVGGAFDTAGGVAVNSVAKWNGNTWSSLGSGLAGLNRQVYALTEYDDGSGASLFVGGEFTSAGGVTVNNIAEWDGSSWSALSGPSGTGMDLSVFSFGVFDDGTGAALIAGGSFNVAGGVMANNVAGWDGSEWSALAGPPGNGLNGGAGAFVEFDDGSGPALYAGGYFETAGGVLVNHIAKWDGSAWSALTGASGTGVNARVQALAVHDDGSGAALYVGGEFTNAGGVVVNYIARWNGSEWSALEGPSGVGMKNIVYALTEFDDGTGPALYAGGWFNKAGGVRVNKIAKWDGTGWSELYGPTAKGMDSHVFALAASSETLYAGGRFITAGGVTTNRVASWDGSEWSALSGPSDTGMDGDVNALAVYDDGTGDALYAGGDFVTGGGVTVTNVARWDGGGWSALSGPSGTGTSRQVRSLTVFDDGTGDALFAAGWFEDAGGVQVNYITRWDGGSWTALSGPAGTGTEDVIGALGVYNNGGDPVLFAGGGFATAGGIASKGVAAWCCDTAAPTDPVSISSTSHTAGVWSTANAIDVAWSGSADSGCSGLTGYSVFFDTSPATVPDAVVDVLHTSDPHSTTSSQRADGTDHWTHLRSCDWLGTCSAGVHLGPFMIDATPPSGPSGLTSTSHTPGGQSCDRSVDLVWTAAQDTLSGLDGYAWAATGTPVWTCDQVKDFEEGASSFSTPDLGDGRWYLHLCASDNAGNWGAVDRAGPYAICPIFMDGFESGETSAWSSSVP